MSKRRAGVKKLAEIEKLESKLLNRIDKLQRNLFSIRTLKTNLTQILAPIQDSQEKSEK